MNTRRLLRSALAACAVVSLSLGTGAAMEFRYETVTEGYYLSSGRGTVVDDAGNAFVFARWIGGSNENNFVVLKYDPEGRELWRRAVAGQDHDVATGLALTDAGDLWITGFTDSVDFPLVDATDDELTGFREAFLMKLSGADGGILFSTFFGGDYRDEGRSVALDNSGRVVMAGVTESTDFPVKDALQPEINGYPYSSSDAFVTILSANGSEVVYSTHLGGTRDDTATAVGVDAAGHVFVAGYTLSTDFPLAGALQAQHGGGERDAFVAKLRPDGSALEYSTYLGGSDVEILKSLAVDAEGIVSVTGSTRSPDFPTTSGAFQETFAGAINGCEVPFGADENCDDFFVTRLSADGSALVYSTFVGGSGTDEGRGIAVDASGRAFVVGYTSSMDFPVGTMDTSAEIAVLRLSPGGDAIEDDATVDSNSANAGHGIGVGPGGDAYFSGAVNVPAEIYVARVEGASTGNPSGASCGRVPDGAGADGTPLLVAKNGDGTIMLSWGDSCMSSDDDYVVYEGTRASLYDHAARLCSTGGELSANLAPASGQRYYLIAPRNIESEGSCGLDSEGRERPASDSACRAQSLGTCD